jgi:hypothetical protein
MEVALERSIARGVSMKTEHTNPAAAEISDDQLDEVAGGVPELSQVIEKVANEVVSAITTFVEAVIDSSY